MAKPRYKGDGILNTRTCFKCKKLFKTYVSFRRATCPECKIINIQNGRKKQMEAWDFFKEERTKGEKGKVNLSFYSIKLAIKNKKKQIKQISI
jgi:phage FluMu protein Com